MSQPTISVIVPVYKVEEYIQECIDSVLAQTFPDFELILVDDGSPDRSGAICEENAIQDPRIRVIHQENQGVTRARANGVAAARGEYITFVDGDDSLFPHSLETLLAPIREGIDIVLGKVGHIHCPPPGEISHESYREMCATLNNIHGACYARLFRKALFDTHVFDIPANIRIGEDVVMNLRIAYNVQNKVYSTAIDVYNYRINQQGVTQTLKNAEALTAFHPLLLDSIHPEDKKRFLSHGLAARLIGYWFNATHMLPEIPEQLKEYHRYLISIRKYSHTRFGFLANILFYSTTPCIRRCVIWLRRIKSHIKH